MNATVVAHKPDVAFDIYWQCPTGRFESKALETRKDNDENWMQGEIYIRDDQIYLGRESIWVKFPIMKIVKISRIGGTSSLEVCFGKYSISLRSEDLQQMIALRDFLLLSIYGHGWGLDLDLDLQYQTIIGGVS